MMNKFKSNIRILTSLLVFSIWYQNGNAIANTDATEGKQTFILLAQINEGDSLAEEGLTTNEDNTDADYDAGNQGFSEVGSEIIASGPEMKGSETISAIDSASAPEQLVEEQTNTQSKFPFYKKWWFSLILMLAVIPYLVRYSNRKEETHLNEVEGCRQKLDELRAEIEQQEELFKTKEEEFNAKFSGEQEIKFQMVGLSKFADLISQSKNDITLLGRDLIAELVGYVGANSGLLYRLNEDDESHPILELLSSYAPDIKEIKNNFELGEGYIGACYKEGTIIELDNVPETYTRISSGLGKSLPRYVAFFPLKFDNKIVGVIELACFGKLEKYKLDFVEKLSQNIASTIAIAHANEKMSSMLEQSRIQAEEMRSQEEELRQNLEEMQSAQDDLNRQIETNKTMQNSLIREKALLDSLLNSLPDSIYFKDLESKFIRISHSMLKLFPVETLDEMVGKSDFDFHPEESAQQYYNDEMEIIKNRKGFIDKLQHELTTNGLERWVSATKLPLIDEKENCIGTFGISKNITEMKMLEIESTRRAEELMSQKEELRQNLEEMKTIQEDLQRNITENKRIHTSLIKEKALLDAIMGNLPDYIYFKDRKSQFLRISKSMLKLFPTASVEDMIGKSDFDFHEKADAQKYYEEEQKIIKNGVGFIDQLQHEHTETGLEQWVIATKMPFYDETGKCVGIFGISKDVSEMKKLEIKANQEADELLAQEEELRQNLEEMQTIQDDLNKRIEENEKMRKEFRQKENELKEQIKKLSGKK